MISTSNKTDWLTLELRRKVALMADGDSFPPVRQLIDEYGVSQPVVMAALKRLKERKLLVAHVGRGSFVSKMTAVGRKRILLLQPDWPSDTIPAIVPGIRQALEAANFECIAKVCDYRQERPLAGIDGDTADLVIFDSPTGPQMAPENLDSFVRFPVPVIVSRREIPLLGMHYVCEDNHSTGARIAAYLHEMGHKKVALLYNEPRYERGALAFRLRGFETFASLNNMTIEMIDCHIAPGEKADRAIDEFAGRIRSGAFDFTAVFTISNSGARYLAGKLRELGVEVPGAVGIITGGDIPAMPGISTFASTPARYGAALAELAGRILEGTSTGTQVCLQADFIDRGSIANLTGRTK